jgi:predicted glycosyltransferase
MKILYAIQGTGNGHISRARDIVPVLMKNHEVDLLISGTQADVELPYPVKYRFKGLSFVFGKNGGINLSETYRKTILSHYFPKSTACR